MDLKEILAVSGKSGLFKIISHTKTGLIAENLTDHKRIPVYASDKISNLEEISVYADDKEIPLKEIFKAINDKETGGRALDPKTEENKLKEYFGQVVPTYDRQRVYVSDIKKILNWYNILHENDMLDFTEPAEETTEKPADEEKPGQTEVAPAKEEKPKLATAGESRKK